MKVWVVTYDAYGDHAVHGVYATAEAAKASVTPHGFIPGGKAEWRPLGDDEWRGGEYTVEAFTLNDEEAPSTDP